MGAHWAVALLFVRAVLATKVAHGISFASQSRRADVYTEGATEATEVPIVAAAGNTRKYLLASFPRLRQVAYCHLPDNVWRPLVIGDVAEPQGVAVDTQTARLFVSDPPNKVIWWYPLAVSGDGHLQTYGLRKAAVEGVIARWLTVNVIGDLYFTGHLASSKTNISSIFRQDATKIAKGNSLGPVEVYSRSNTGMPKPKAWEPAGIAVDSLYLYWGNGADGTEHGAVVKGSRMNVGTLAQDMRINSLSDSVDEVHGLTATGNHIFYLTPNGVYGVLKTGMAASSDPEFGLVAAALKGSDTNSPAWRPTSIAWDGDSFLYFTESGAGKIYTMPAVNMRAHNLTLYADAPGVHGLAIIGFGRSQGASARGVISLVPGLVAAAVAVLSAMVPH